MTEQQPLLEISHLTKTFTLGGGGFFSRAMRQIHATNDVSLSIFKGQTLGLVGESGSGKSTLSRLILGLETPSGGDIKFEGKSILGLKGDAMRQFRQDVQMVFQDPYGSLNPRMDVASLVSEGWVVHPNLRPSNPRARIAELLEQVGLRPEWANRYPSQFSGGQRQRIGIARALAVRPKLLICDEAVSALDVSVQAQILNLLKGLQRDLGVAYLFVSHDLSVVRYISHDVAVMQLGRIVEQGPARQLYEYPQHPYTQALLAAIPSFDAPIQDALKPQLRGDVPDPGNPPSGCTFRTRCWRERPLCAQERPPLSPDGGVHRAACHYPGQQSETQSDDMKETQ